MWRIISGALAVAFANPDDFTCEPVQGHHIGVLSSGIKKDQANPQWTKSDFAQAKPAAEFFGPETYTGLVELTKRGRGKRGPQKAPTKIAASVRFDPDVLERLRASGRGWATLVNDTMRALLFSADAEKASSNITRNRP